MPARKNSQIVSKPRGIPGAQTAQRAMRILKLLGSCHAQGLTTQQIVAATGWDRSAVQRALNSLVEEGLAEREPQHKRYHLGVEAMHIGRATLQLSPLVGRFKPYLDDIARVTGDTVFLSVRIGDFALCVYREEGSSPLRVPRTRKGDLRVLGTTAGGIALLATLGEAEIRAIFDRHVEAFQQARLDFAALREKISWTRRHGFAIVSDNISEGVTSLGICLGLGGEPFAAVALAAATSRMGGERIAALHELLRKLDDSSRMP